MDTHALLPKDKFDDSNLKVIRKLPDAEIKPIIYELLEWIQDYNWPIANQVLQILVERQELVFPYISGVLKGNDIMWKYWILELLVPKLKGEYQFALREDIEALASEKGTDEDTLAIIEQAKVCIDKCFTRNNR